MTGISTRFIMKALDNALSDSEKNIWWGDVNQPLSPEIFDTLYLKCFFFLIDYL